MTGSPDGLSGATPIVARDAATLGVWVDGERCDPGARHVSARDRGVTLADGVFETMRVVNGRIFRLDRHLARLTQALMSLRIAPPPGLRDSVQQAVEQSDPDVGSVRVTVTRGVGPAGLAPAPDSRPTAIVITARPPVFPPAIYTAGLGAHVASGRRNERAPTTGMKTLAFTDAIAGLLEAQSVGADEALFLDTEDHLCEASASNLFVWKGDALVTPPLSCGALPGITRAAILELAYGLRLEVTDDPFNLDLLHASPEAFLTSSLRGIVPLVRVDGQAIGAGVPGPVTARIAEAYDALVRREC